MEQAKDTTDAVAKQNRDAEVHQALLLLLRQLAHEIAKELHAQGQTAMQPQTEMPA